MSGPASSEDCPCCQRCLAPGPDTDRALVVAFVGGVARMAYSKGPMFEACQIYAAGLDRAATDLEETARVIISMADQSESKAEP